MKTAEDFIKQYMNNPISDDPKMSVHIKNAFNAGLEASPFESVFNKYGDTHFIEKIKGTNCDFSNYKSNQSSCYGDGKTYHFKLTRKADNEL
jgi:hypothetical protein